MLPHPPPEPVAADAMPIVLIPGIQGRWEWMQPAIDTLTRHRPVLTFSLGDLGVDASFEDWSRHIDVLLTRRGASRAAIVGVSFGGLIAAYYAATRAARTACLVLVSAPSPFYRPPAQDLAYIERPRRSLPLFAIRGAGRLWPEVAASRSTAAGRLSFVVSHGLRTLRAPVSPTQMARWVRRWLATDLVTHCRSIRTPTLVVTGEDHLDRVVPVASSLEYLEIIPGCGWTRLPGTGHMGLMTKPEAFADIIEPFVANSTSTHGSLAASGNDGTH